MWTDYLKTFPQYLLPKKALTALAGGMAKIETPWIKNYLIQSFIQKYQVNMQEALIEDPKQYRHFNDFFIRHLKPALRPISSADLISPVDGTISAIGEVQAGTLLQAKGRYYTVQALLAQDPVYQQFAQGRFVTLYLAPKDYHRVHMPLQAQLQQSIYVPGQLFSVQPSSTQVIHQLFARNQRLIVLFETSIGLMAMILVGATIVGNIGTSWQGALPKTSSILRSDHTKQPLSLSKGSEMGYFQLGSTVILLFAKGDALQWRSDLKIHSRLRLGEALGHFA
jgi:phosphatidylserine decarboxylase